MNLLNGPLEVNLEVKKPSKKEGPKIPFQNKGSSFGFQVVLFSENFRSIFGKDSSTTAPVY